MKTRTVTRTRWVPHTEAGETRTVPEDYTEDIPVPPRDWDHILQRAALAIAVGFTGISVIWSAVSGGGLLTTTASEWIAYPVALAYDAAWITCLILEWLARYDADRARLPRRFGYAALIVAMIVIFAHGQLAGQWVAGLAGAAISLIAKALWALVLRQISFELPPLTREWVRVSRAEVGAQLAIIQQRRQLDRMRGQSQALLAATGMTATPAMATVTRDATPAVVPSALTPLLPIAAATPAVEPSRNADALLTVADVAQIASTTPPPPPNSVPPGTALLPVICRPRHSTPSHASRTAAPTPATPAAPATQHPTATPTVATIERVAAAATPAVEPSRNADALLTVADVARLRGVKPSTVRSWVNRGKLTPASSSADGRNVFDRNAVAALDTPAATPAVAPSQMEGGYA
ncbi:helix-turn-helix domain-containing protein [Streptomyces sp. NPDC087850]|uniref:helix-turn-helix domain-containing protein n=1 Tax=Streptomyces sp. NPDC087850 TaxID=3365809 RepID=UPI00381A01CB